MEEKRGRKRRKGGEIEREGKEDPIASFSDFRHSDDQSSSHRELKSIYTTRAMLQEVGILPTLVYFHLKGTGFRY